MSQPPDDRGEIDKDDFELDQAKLRRIRERVLKAEKEKLHMDLPRGVINDIEDIVREEIN
jgi:hypothetical protein